jgi:hypothetical protein
MLNTMFKLLLGLESSRVQPPINVTAAAMEVPATMEILGCSDVWICKTAASNLAKSKDGV